VGDKCLFAGEEVSAAGGASSVVGKVCCVTFVVSLWRFVEERGGFLFVGVFLREVKREGMVVR